MLFDVLVLHAVLLRKNEYLYKERIHLIKFFGVYYCCILCYILISSDNKNNDNNENNKNDVDDDDDDDNDDDDDSGNDKRFSAIKVSDLL